MNFLVINGSLKLPKKSNTHVMCVELQKRIKKQQHHCGIIDLASLPPYVPATSKQNDHLDEIIKLIIFRSPEDFCVVRRFS